MKRIAAFLIVFVFAIGYFNCICSIRRLISKLTLNAKTKVLQAVIMHNTSNPLNHYINKVDVGLNGKEIIEHAISREDNNESQTVSYLIPDVKDGDVLSVEGYCSISGKLEREITVKTGDTQDALHN